MRKEYSGTKNGTPSFGQQSAAPMLTWTLPRQTRWFFGLVLVCISLVPWTGVGAQPSGSAVATQHQLQTMEFRLERVERMLDSGVLTEMLQNIDQLQMEIRQLRGQVETLENDVRGLRNRQRDQFRGLDERVGALESGVTSAPTQVAPEPPPEARVPLPAAAEQDAYQAAFDRLMGGEYEAAVLQLEQFLERFPSGLYSANALYWLAEAKYATRDFSGALLNFKAVRERFPNSDKAGDALLKIGYSHFELGQMDLARTALNQVLAQFPGTTLARLAQDRLRRIEGRQGNAG